MTYARYQKAFERIRDELKLNPEHRPHDGRTHFVTMAKRYGVDEYAIKYMVGHKIPTSPRRYIPSGNLSGFGRKSRK